MRHDVLVNLAHEPTRRQSIERGVRSRVVIDGNPHALGWLAFWGEGKCAGRDQWIGGGGHLQPDGGRTLLDVAQERGEFHQAGFLTRLGEGNDHRTLWRTLRIQLSHRHTVPLEEGRECVLWVKDGHGRRAGHELFAADDEDVVAILCEHPFTLYEPCVNRLRTAPILRRQRFVEQRSAARAEFDLPADLPRSAAECDDQFSFRGGVFVDGGDG